MKIKEYLDLIVSELQAIKNRFPDYEMEKLIEEYEEAEKKISIRLMNVLGSKIQELEHKRRLTK